MAEVKKRIEWLDISKGIAIILVVLGHTLSSSNPLWSIIYSFHMPLFFFVAGYTFKSKPIVEELKSSALRLLLPYVVCFVLISLISVLWLPQLDLGWMSKQALGFFFASAIEVKFFELPAVGIIWFFWALFASRIFLNLTLAFFDRYKVQEAIRFTFYLVLSIIGGLVSGKIFLPFALDLIPATTLFLYLGYLAKQKDFFSSLNRNIVIFVAALILWVVCLIFTPYTMDNFFHTRLYGNPLAALSGTLVCIYIAMIVARVPILKNYLIFMGAGSIIVFFLHGIGGNLISWTSFPIIASISSETIAQLLAFVFRMIFITLFMWLLLLNPLARQKKAPKPQTTA